MKRTLLFSALTLLLSFDLFAHDAHKEELDTGETKKVRGEVIDLICYIDHGAVGEKHAGCAKTCIANGLPVGLRGDDGKTYILVGEHTPLNNDLAQFAAKKITVEGKVTSRDGFNLIENAVVQK